jgi:hypothetical protein
VGREVENLGHPSATSLHGIHVQQDPVDGYRRLIVLALSEAALPHRPGSPSEAVRSRDRVCTHMSSVQLAVEGRRDGALPPLEVVHTVARSTWTP